MQTTTIMICDDSEVACAGLTALLSKFTEFKVIASAHDGLEAVQKHAELNPQVVIMDVGMPHLDGIEATQKIKEHRPDTRVLMLTATDGEENVLAAFASGADGYCQKSAAAVTVIEAVRVVASGAHWIDPGIAISVLRNSARDSLRTTQQTHGPTAFQLSQREVEVLELLVEGKSNIEIGKKLYISAETVKTHLRRIMDKLAVSDRTQAAVKAVRMGICR